MRNNNTLKITIMALAIALNFIGGLIAISLKLPIYFDSIGTVLIWSCTCNINRSGIIYSKLYNF